MDKLNYALNVFYHVMHPPTRWLNHVQDALNRKDFETATARVDRAKQKYPDRSDINKAYAQIHSRREDWEKVRDAVERIASNPASSFDQLAEAARLLCKLGDEDRAIEIYRRLGKTSQGRWAGMVWNSIGHIYLQRNESDKALEAFVETICRSGPAPWVRVITALKDCPLEAASKCREMLLHRPAKKMDAYRYHKMMSLLEQKLVDGGKLDSNTVLQSMRRATILYYQRFFPDLEIDVLRPPLKPAFLVIGAMKCGTTTLFELITQHPSCLAAVDKEIQFFQFPHLSDQWYLEHFPRVNPDRGFVTGDASPGYYIFDIVERVKSLLPDTKLIFIQRDPARRVISHIRHNSKIGLRHFNPMQAISGIDQLEAEIESAPENAEQIILDIAYRKRPQNNFVALGCYELLLRRWMRAFGKDRLMKIQLEELGNHPQETMNRVFEFIGLPPFKIKPVKSNAGSYDDADPQTVEALARLGRFYEKMQKLSESSDL